MKLCLADAASRSASSSTPSTSPRVVTTGMCRNPHSNMSISTVSAVRSAVTRRAGVLITVAIGTVLKMTPIAVWLTWKCAMSEFLYTLVA